MKKINREDLIEGLKVFTISVLALMIIVAMYFIVIAVVLTSRVPGLELDSMLMDRKIINIKDDIEDLEDYIDKIELQLLDVTRKSDVNKLIISGNSSNIEDLSIRWSETTIGGIKPIIDEIWDELDYLRKRVE